jgi:outer membrane lipoprotein SlyB
MRTRIASIASVTALAAMLAACGTVDPYGPNNYPAGTTSSYPTTTYPAATSGFVEFGRVSNIELVQATNTMGAPAGETRNSTAGTVIGGVLGALVGSQIGSGGGRAAAAVLGAVGGAVVGNKIAKDRDGRYVSDTGAVYRISVQTDRGDWRSYDVSATGDLRVGDRVRIENNVLYRS